MGSARSSKTRRLTRIKPGYYQPPKGTVFVPGMQWLGLVVVGLQQPAVLAGMQWWSKFATHRRCEELWWLGRAMAAWGREVVHIFDRGFAGQPWLEECCQLGIRFVMRWPKEYLLSEHDGWVWNRRKAWMITRGKRSQSTRLQWNGHLHRWIEGGVLAVPVHHPKVAGNFWLVVSRPGKGQLPWYLLTNEEIHTSEQIWEIVDHYARRWQIEMTWRYTKSESGFESPRSWMWEARQRLLMIAAMAFAFLLSLLQPSFDAVRGHLLKQWCPRTGERFRQFDVPLYRLREALSFLWLYYPPYVQLFPFSG
ncbi:transposase [Dictyobacter aurantiacus]|uniref:Transposase IS4-like domain-containing protein n=1 Tax=Dictyobacter aurantiacus TaxID=1936993 RepID=A0A401Z747_9CHLR|nr:transposase [Dictyobacter aurantiacus]GCE02690.1 hypothetical protein KDAU_00190 [Dictyobacter aurantiacus]